jgi:uncharacterized protein YbjT (DUF2867 family)
MKYVITGSLGHISKPVVIALVQAGHDVTVITSNSDRVKEIESLGAKAQTGSVEDTAFLQKAFAGAEAVYTMVPPNYAAKNVKEYIGQVGKNYAEAIKAVKTVKYIVNLSSIGAHLPDGVGPVSGLYRVEQALNAVPGVQIRHLRPSYFYYNLLSMIPMVKHMDVLGSNFSVSDKKFPLVAPLDIAAVATEELLQLNFTGISTRYIAGDEVSTADIASVLGKAVGKPHLQWVAFTDEQALGGMLQGGLPEPMAKEYVEMGQAIQSGIMSEDYWKHHPAQLEKTKLADFAASFAGAYNSN